MGAEPQTRQEPTPGQLQPRGALACFTGPVIRHGKRECVTQLR